MPVENPDYEKLQILCEQLKQQNKQLIDENKNLSSKNLYEKDKKNEDNLQIKEEDNQSTSSSISSFGEDEFIDLDAQDLDDDDTWLVKPEVVDQAYTDSFATSMDYLLQDLNTPEKRAESRRKLEAFESPINYKKTGKSSSNYTPRMNESKTPCNANAFTPLNFSPESLLNETGGETIPATTDSPIALNAKHSTEAVSRFENTDFQASLETTDSSISPPTSDGINTRVSAALGDRDTVSTPTTATGDNVGTRGEAQRPRPSDYVNAVDGGEGESGSRSANKPSGQQPTTRRVLKLPTSRVVNPYAAEVNPRTLMYDLDMDGSSRPNEEYDEELSNINGGQTTERFRLDEYRGYNVGEIDDGQYSRYQSNDNYQSNDRYADDRYSDDRYENNRYEDNLYEDNRYTDNGYADERYAGDRREDNRYAGDRYEDNRYADDNRQRRDYDNRDTQNYYSNTAPRKTSHSRLDNGGCGGSTYDVRGRRSAPFDSDPRGPYPNDGKQLSRSGYGDTKVNYDDVDSTYDDHDRRATYDARRTSGRRNEAPASAPRSRVEPRGDSTPRQSRANLQPSHSERIRRAVSPWQNRRRSSDEINVQEIANLQEESLRRESSPFNRDDLSNFRRSDNSLDDLQGSNNSSIAGNTLDDSIYEDANTSLYFTPEEKKTHQSPATRRTLAQFSCSSPSLAKPMTPTKHLETSNATLQTPQRSGLKAPVKSRLQLPMKAVRPLQQGLSASSTSAATCPSASTSCIPRTASTSKLPLPRRSGLPKPVRVSKDKKWTDGCY